MLLRCLKSHVAAVNQLRESAIIKRIINAVIFLAKEEMAFRGHDEKTSSEDWDPFKELLRFFIFANFT